MEKLYDPHNGVMHLIGCRKVSTDLPDDRGDLDYLIEGVYSGPTNELMMDPTVKNNITSQREEGDPLYVSSITFKSKTIRYNILNPKMHELDVAFCKIFEGGLRVLVLLVAIGFTWSQKVYMDRTVCLALSVYLKLFALQIFSFGFLIIVGQEILLPSKETL